MQLEIVSPQVALKSLAQVWRQPTTVLPSGVEFTFGKTHDGEKLVQAVHFDVEEWSGKTARAWLAEHGLRSDLMATQDLAHVPAGKMLLTDIGRVDGDFELIRKVDEQQMCFGWLYVCRRKDGTPVVDHSGEVISIGDLEKAGYGYALDSRVAGVMHTKDANGNTIQVGRMCEMFMCTPEKKTAMGIPDGILPDAMWIGLKIDDAAVWARIKGGELRMFSLGGTAIRRALGSVQ